MTKLELRFAAVAMSGALALVLTTATAGVADDVYGDDAYTRRAHTFDDEEPVPWTGGGGGDGAHTVYFWTTDRGTYSFTDDERRIPARYRAGAEARTLGAIDQYGRYTRIDPIATERMRRLAENEQSSARVCTAPGGCFAAANADSNAGGGRAPEYLNLNTGGRLGGGSTGISVPVYGDGPPTIVENVRVKSRGQNATRNITVIKRGGRIISVIKPQQNETSVTTPSEESITGGW